MRCEKCGNFLTDQDRYCPVCGHLVPSNQNSYNNNPGSNGNPNGNDYQQNPYGQNQYNNQYQNQYQNQGNQQGYPQPMPSGGGGDSMLKVLLIIGVIVLIGSVSVLAYMLLSSGDSGDKEESEETVTTEAASEEETEAADSTTETDKKNGGNTVIINNDVNGGGSSSGSSDSGSSSGQKTSGYIIEDSDSRYLTSSDLSGLSSWELKLARNEIYARHGRTFDDDDLQDYFDSKSWYSGTVSPGNFSESVFNKYEKANVDYIKAYENGTASSSAGSSGSSSGSSSGEYILPQSSTSYLEYSDIAGLSSYQLKLARNEIYARHGRRFNDDSLQSYFDSKSWYNGTISPDNFDESVLSKVEKSNIDFIKSYE